MTPERPSDPEPRVAALSRGPITYADAGEGPVVLALHGLPGSHRDFRWLASALDGHVRFVRPDLPGWGETPARTGSSRSVAGRAAVALELLDALGIDRAIVLGHSMGGPVALRIAAQHPDRARALALLASPGLRPHRAIARSPLWLTSSLLAVPGLRRLLYPALRRAYSRGGFPGSLTDVQRAEALRGVAGLSFDDQRRDAERLACPTLVAWSGDDPLVEVPVSEELAEACPLGPRMGFPDAGHNLQKSMAVELAQALLAWGDAGISPGT